MKGQKGRTIAIAVITLSLSVIAQNGFSTDAFGVKKSGPIAQVVNSSGTLMNGVRVASVTFTKNLNYCADGCSTEFKGVPVGSSRIMVQAAAGSPYLDVGLLSGFQANMKYSVNMVRRGASLCADLYSREKTDKTFNDDASKKKVSSVCKRTLTVTK